jgi:hypothetical protein
LVLVSDSGPGSNFWFSVSGSGRCLRIISCWPFGRVTSQVLNTSASSRRGSNVQLGMLAPVVSKAIIRPLEHFTTFFHFTDIHSISVYSLGVSGQVASGVIP